MTVTCTEDGAFDDELPEFEVIICDTIRFSILEGSYSSKDCVRVSGVTGVPKRSVNQNTEDDLRRR